MKRLLAIVLFCVLAPSAYGGTYAYSDGTKYVGEMAYGLPNGQGTTTSTNGTKYVGEFKDGKFDGHGTLTWQKGQWKGDKYVGEFKDGKRHGQGTYTWANGNNYTGEWKADKKWDGVEYFPSGEVLATYSNGKECLGCKPQLPTTPRLRSSGTGFAINKDYIVTAYHVIDDCRKVEIRHSHKIYQTKVVASDASNDLGLLRLGQSFSGTAELRGGKQARLGDRIATYGYPLFGKLSDSAKITQGIINSLAGLENNSSRFQYDAPTQRGNSGGPVLDFSGNIVGVVVSGLDNSKTQTINFAVKSYVVEGFLSSNNVSFEKAESTQKLELPDIAKKAEKFTVLVGCWQ